MNDGFGSLNDFRNEDYETPMLFASSNGGGTGHGSDEGGQEDND